MKIAVASEGKDENAKVSQVGGRAPFYLIFEDKKLAKVIKNPFRTGGGGAGTGMAQLLANEGVKRVISGHFGPNMKMWLSEKKIEMIEVLEPVTVKEAVEGVIK